MAPKAERQVALPCLNSRQRQVLGLVRKGLRNSEIANIMRVSERSVKAYVSQLFDVFEVTNRTELAVFSQQEDHPPITVSEPGILPLTLK
jgi:DNA-binding NarL/FixJ family response regulator